MFFFCLNKLIVEQILNLAATDSKILKISFKNFCFEGYSECELLLMDSFSSFEILLLKFYLGLTYWIILENYLNYLNSFYNFLPNLMHVCCECYGGYINMLDAVFMGVSVHGYAIRSSNVCPIMLITHLVLEIFKMAKYFSVDLGFYAYSFIVI